MKVQIYKSSFKVGDNHKSYYAIARIEGGEYLYLHKDGGWRPMAVNPDGDYYGGWFGTKEEIIKLLNLHDYEFFFYEITNEDL